MKQFKTTITILFSILLLAVLGVPSYAETVQLADGQIFDSDFYAETYPDVKATFGTDFTQLLNHYLNYGIKEGRYPSLQAVQAAAPALSVNTAEATATISLTGDAQQTAAPIVETAPSSPLVPIGQLANRKSLQKKCTNAEFQAAYDAASQIVVPLVGLPRTEQAAYIASAVRYLVDHGYVLYTTSIPHYDDPYGYFITGVGSCAGETRAIGLCLNMLGIPYEHVNEGKWSHQWCRVPMEDGSYWIVDAYGLYVGPEPAPYRHPRY